MTPEEKQAYQPPATLINKLRCRQMEKVYMDYFAVLLNSLRGKAHQAVPVIYNRFKSIYDSDVAMRSGQMVRDWNS